MTVWIRDDLRRLFGGLTFEALLRLGQHRVRVGPDGSRHTAWLERGGRRFFLKVHEGIGWREILKCWLQGRRAIVDARPEAHALERLATLGIPAPRLAAYGVEGLNPATRRSFVLTESLEDTEDLAEFLARTPPLAFEARVELTRELARLAGGLHAAGIAHQDLYLTHFRLRRQADGTPELFLIDLHRARTERAPARRWILKDLAALRFSTLALPLTHGDLARFWRTYQGQVRWPVGREAERALRRRIEDRALRVRGRVLRRDAAR